MLVESKLLLPPLAALGLLSSEVIGTFPNSLRIVLDVAALAILFAGFLVLGRLRAQAVAAEGAAKAWREERDAAAVRAERLSEDATALREEIAALRTMNAELQARPTLDGLAAQIAINAASLDELRKAVHEVAVRLPVLQEGDA